MDSDKSILDTLFSDHRSGLIRFVTRKVSNTEDAEDIAHNAFIRLQRLENADKLDNLKAYLYQTASNLAIDQLRRDKLHSNYIKRESHQNNDGGHSALSTDLDTPDKLLVAQRQLSQINKTLENLPEKARSAFLMHRNQGLTYSQIALELEVSVSSVEKYILQALKMFRKALQHESEEELIG